MTIDDANREARKRWGAPGDARTRDGQCFVGTIGGERLPNGTFPYGQGWTWEDAFADADRRAAAPPSAELDATKGEIEEVRS